MVLAGTIVTNAFQEFGASKAAVHAGRLVDKVRGPFRFGLAERATIGATWFRLGLGFSRHF